MGPIHAGLKLASDILGACGEDKAQAIIDAIYNSFPEKYSL